MSRRPLFRSCGLRDPCVRAYYRGVVVGALLATAAEILVLILLWSVS